MKFLVSRTSDWFSKTKPCDEAIKETVIKEYHSGEMRVGEEWFVEIDSLEDLMCFIQTYGDIVLQPSYFKVSDGDKKVDYEIEIYDDYRE